jgi:hypothetical protein
VYRRRDRSIGGKWATPKLIAWKAVCSGLLPITVSLIGFGLRARS